MTKLIVALDEPTLERALEVVRATTDVVDWYKVGYQAYYGYRDAILSTLRELDKSIFLDLKLHDIPNTVEAAVRVLGSGVAMLTVHAAGGEEMLRAAAAARDEIRSRGGNLQLVAVTLLTSLGQVDLRQVGIDESPLRTVSIRAALAAKASLDGIVCAVEEVPVVRNRIDDPDFVIVCPGIRPYGADAADQQRIATPAQAVLAGANYIVVGRPIAQAGDPGAAARAVIDEMAASQRL